MSQVSLQTNPKDEHSVFNIESKKIRKVCAALYVVTDLFEETEPLKRHIRNQATQLLNTTHVSKNEHRKDVSHKLISMLNYIDSIMSFIELAKTVRLVSEMNARVISNELSLIHGNLVLRHHDLHAEDMGLSFALHEKTQIHEHLSVQENEIDAPGMTEKNVPVTNKEMGMSKREEKQAKLEARVSSLISSNHQENVSVEKTRTVDVVEKTITQPQVNSVVSQYQNQGDIRKIENSVFKTKPSLTQKSDRQTKILDIIVLENQKDNEVSTSDISKHIPQVTDKTLQRDLNDMIQKGLIKKIGTRRWSKYVLA